MRFSIINTRDRGRVIDLGEADHNDSLILQVDGVDWLGVDLYPLPESALVNIGCWPDRGDWRRVAELPLPSEDT